jgi:hypothetical protein
MQFGLITAINNFKIAAMDEPLFLLKKKNFKVNLKKI